MLSSQNHNSEEPLGLLRTLAAVFSGVLFGLFLSKFKTPPQESANSIPPTTETKNQNSGRKILSPLSDKTPPTLQTSEQSRYCCQYKTPRWKIFVDCGMLLATTGAFLAAGTYAYLARCQLQTMRREVEALTGALLNIDVESTWDNQAYISVNIANRGRANANKIHWESQMQRVSLPSRTTIGEPISWNFDIPELDYLPSTYVLRGKYVSMSPKELTAFVDLREAIKVTGAIRYYNGFESRSIDTCYYIFGPVEYKNKAGRDVQGGTAPRSTCDDFDRLFFDMMKTKKSIAAQ